ncbi:hypothetical protein SAMN05421827_11472 [Pedobacter terrae]|uniref:Uncharacterized protein n=1 Tax=Pedobacter terrae TaxID=405671 RepID=A0A1G7YS25_9SPHI|nr:hypothetical protein SAMN05421827_11472 [Pedobacter terrae]
MICKLILIILVKISRTKQLTFRKKYPIQVLDRLIGDTVF